MPMTLPPSDIRVDLWNKTGRHFTFSLDVGPLMGLTSRSRTDPPPHDLEEIYRAARMDMPQNAVELFLEAKSAPEDIWTMLLAATSTDSYKAIYDDSGKTLTPQLRRSLGELSQDEIYFRVKFPRRARVMP
ncbi:hypothetical protein [Rhizobium sp. K102]|uniref:hypothetical protein n=1 Tax=Rhizobium sp. K102 TaxID=2918527 RepID=UPI001EFA4138|nr:hypothetical protein [Rhizobium sp. K102]ULR47313.1 hypothetical protein MHI61_28380 [Rhizobium sp. K102]